MMTPAKGESVELTIVGGSGFVGSRVCQLMRSQGRSFEIIDLKLSPLFPDETKIVDIRDLAALRTAIRGRSILHLAAVHRDDVSDIDEYYTTNVIGTENVCKVATERDINRLIFTSTVAVYGFADPNTGEDGRINPFNHYGKSKFQAEDAVRRWCHESGAARIATIIRPTVVFGEGNRGNVYNLLNTIANRRFLMIGDGSNRKSMAYVGNLAAFLLKTLAQNENYQLFNYVDPPDFDMNALVKNVRRVLLKKDGVGLRVPYAAGVVAGAFADVVAQITGRKLPISTLRVRKFASTTSFTSKAHGAYGFLAPFSLDEGLAQTLESEFINPDPNRPIFYTE